MKYTNILKMPIHMILVVSRNYIYLLKQTLLFYVHVNVKNVYLSLNMLNMSFSKQFYIFARILLGQSWHNIKI
jgi:hypothetical protein